MRKARITLTLDVIADPVSPEAFTMGLVVGLLRGAGLSVTNCRINEAGGEEAWTIHDLWREQSAEATR